ncbi:DUF6420 family protein [Streptomyces sp. NPDC001652]|uniref:DUF6420 family protein n=1 Tax=Streptomyces sp. NPDC001652 TaxID=3154393 RepID=UPI00331772BA
MDHLCCPAQFTDEKTAGFKRLVLAAEGYGVRVGYRHVVVFSDGVHRFFEVRKGSIARTPFVRAALAAELGTFPSRTGSCRRAKRWPGRSAGTAKGTTSGASASGESRPEDVSGCGATRSAQSGRLVRAGPTIGGVGTAHVSGGGQQLRMDQTGSQL